MKPKYEDNVRDEEPSYWLSYSDMMAGLLLMFVIIISFTMMQAKHQYEKKEAEVQKQAEQLETQKKQLAEQETILTKQTELLESQKGEITEQKKKLNDLVGVRRELIAAIKEEFEGSDSNVTVDPQTGAIVFDSSILFDYNDSKLKETGQKFLQQFLPQYIGILLGPNYRDYIAEIIIEGHTDTSGSYLHNLDLSQKRALAVATYCLQDNGTVLSEEERNVLSPILTANGKSYSNPIYNNDGTVNMDASRRVEFKFRFKEEEMIQEMADILNGEGK